MKIFRENIDSLADVIVHICNLTVPASIKIGKVTCIFKAGDPTVLKNYRPISVLNSFSKILEKLVANQVVKFFDDNMLFSREQFGFRAGISTNEAVQTMVTSLYGSLDKGKMAVGVFLDLAKAFDSLNREILIDKLGYYGFGGVALNWFRSLIKNRYTQYKYCVIV